MYSAHTAYSTSTGVQSDVFAPFTPGPLALHSRLPQQSHPNLPTRLPFNQGSPSALPNPVIKAKAQMTRPGRFSPRQGQSMTRIGRRASAARELTSRFWQMSAGERLPHLARSAV